MGYRFMKKSKTGKDDRQCSEEIEFQTQCSAFIPRRCGRGSEGESLAGTLEKAFQDKGLLRITKCQNLGHLQSHLSKALPFPLEWKLIWNGFKRKSYTINEKSMFREFFLRVILTGSREMELQEMRACQLCDVSIRV